MRDLADLVFGFRNHGTMVAIRFYIDGSGKDSDPVLTVGGYSASDITCSQIEMEWLKKTRGKVFHFTDFGTKSCELGSNDWSPSKRKAFLESLCAIVNADGVNIHTMSIAVEPFQKLLETCKHSVVFGTPYSGCAIAALMLANVLLEDAGFKFVNVAYIFEDGDRKHEILNVMDEMKTKPEYAERRSISFLPKKTTLLQPADFIVGTVQKLATIAKDPVIDILREDEAPWGPILLGLDPKIVAKHPGAHDILIRRGSQCFFADTTHFSGLVKDFDTALVANPKLLERWLKPLRNQGRRTQRKKVRGNAEKTNRG